MSAEPQNRAPQAVPKHLESKMMLATARNDDLDPEAMKVLPGMRAHQTFARATDWRNSHMARKAP
jgi:hypothetical protein